jgi:hypothetical protein
MTALPTQQVLVSILEMMKQQAIYLHRQHGWLIAVAEAVENNPDLLPYLKQHPFYDLGPRPDVQITQSMIANIDALIQQLRNPVQ